MILLVPHERGVVLPIKAQAGARKDEIKGIHDGHLKVSVTQTPEKGKANKAILALLANKLDLRGAQLELLSGETQPFKRILIHDIAIADLTARITSGLDG